MTHWVWKDKAWPTFTWDESQVTPHLSRARLAQGKLLGMIQTISADISAEMDAIILGEQAIDTSAIEGEHLNRESVRSSIAKKLGLDKAGLNANPDRYIDGLLDMLLDATQHYQNPLTEERLCGWHAALFPTGYSGIQKITIGAYRVGPIHIISGKIDQPTVHYEALPAESLSKEMKQFLSWFNNSVADGDGLLRAGLAHLWFELLHPFDDGNGRVGRAIIDLALAQDECLDSRHYSLSSAILQDRKQYYASLQQACRGDLDVTAWMVWFLGCFEKAVISAIETVAVINFKSKFWERFAKTELNARQIKVLNRLLDVGKKGFEGGMATRKYMQITRTSRATAYRELNALVEKGCLKVLVEKGRSAAYEIDWSE